MSRWAESPDVVRPRAGSSPVHHLVGNTGSNYTAQSSGCWRSTARKTAVVTQAAHRRRRRHRQIAAAAGTTSDVDNASQVGSLLDQVNGPVTSFTADGAYDQDGVYRQVTARHPEAFVIAAPLQRRAERHGADGADDARPSSADHRRTRPHDLAAGVWLQLACFGRSRHQAFPASHLGRATLPNQLAPSDRGRDCRERIEPDARVRTSRVRPPPVIPRRTGFIHHRGDQIRRSNVGFAPSTSLNSCAGRIRPSWRRPSAASRMPSSFTFRRNETLSRLVSMTCS